MLDAAWQEAGYSCMGDYVVALLAEKHNMPVPDWARPARRDDTGMLDEDMFRRAG